RVRGMTPAAPPRVVVLAAVVVALDQITKLVGLGRLAPGVPIVVIDGFLSLTLVLNPGLAFGLLASVPAEWRWVVALLSVGALVILVQVALRVLPRGRWPDHGAIGLLFGGAVGTLIDRARLGALVASVAAYYRVRPRPRRRRGPEGRGTARGRRARRGGNPAPRPRGARSGARRAGHCLRGRAGPRPGEARRCRRPSRRRSRARHARRRAAGPRARG